MNMDQSMEYNRNFSLPAAYQFLQDNGLGDKAIEIKTSSDKFKSYSSTLRRAKIIVLVKENNLFDRFVDEVWLSGKTKKGVSRTRFFEKLCQRFLDDQEGITQDEDESDEESPVEETQFAYEDDLRNYLANNLHIIEDGLRLYVSDTGEKGIEYLIPNTQRRIDILAMDRNNDFVVIELKVSRGYERTIGQALYYQSMIKSVFKTSRVRVIIIARELSEELRMGTKYLSDFQLFEYQLSLTLNKV